MSEEIQHPDIVDMDGFEPTEPFEIEIASDNDASASLRNIAYREAQIQRINEYMEAEVNKLRKWRDYEIERMVKQIEWLSKPLEIFMRRLHEESGGKVKSRKYPNGTIAIRKLPDTIDLAVDFNPEDHKGEPFIAETVKYSADKKAVMAAVKETGELPDWACLVPGDLKFSIKLGE